LVRFNSCKGIIYEVFVYDFSAYARRILSNTINTIKISSMKDREGNKGYTRIKTI
jgi:hypothetical protein